MLLLQLGGSQVIEYHTEKIGEALERKIQEHPRTVFSPSVYRTNSKLSLFYIQILMLARRNLRKNDHMTLSKTIKLVKPRRRKP
jgi:hypothetical protein